MAIEINGLSVSDKNGNQRGIAAPTIVLSGDNVSIDEPVPVSNTIVTNEIVINEDKITKRSKMVFRGNVRVSFIPDPNWEATNYGSLNVNNFVGKIYKKNNVGLRSDTYYTTNGKDPIRTSANLYTVPFVLTRNESGYNTVLKVRTFAEGRASEVRTVRIIIDRVDDNLV
jgi:hypothetical protein